MADSKFAAKINAPDIEPRYRHQKIFEVFDSLGSGEVMELSNDHDPKPLYYQMSIEREGTFEWEYTEKGPDNFRVSITKK